jgi:hypothetical protein
MLHSKIQHLQALYSTSKYYAELQSIQKFKLLQQFRVGQHGTALQIMIQQFILEYSYWKYTVSEKDCTHFYFFF